MFLKRWKKHKSVMIGTCSGHMGRYREFDACLHYTLKPPGSKFEWAIGTDPAFNLNRLIEALKDLECDYLWILGDDHVWKNDLLMKLLDHDKDIVVPYCLRRQMPFWHVVHFGQNHGFYRAPYDSFNGMSGLVNITGMTIGNSGMLIKRRVFEKMAEMDMLPWFESGMTKSDVLGADLYFCEKARKAGFKLWLDLDNVIGHILHMAVFPERGEDGNWMSTLQPPHLVFPKRARKEAVRDKQMPEGQEGWIKETLGGSE